MAATSMFIATTRFSIGLYYLFIYYMCLIACLCVLFGISGFLRDKGILVILELRVFW